MISVKAKMPDGSIVTEKVKYGSINVIPLGIGETAHVEIELDHVFTLRGEHSWSGSVEGGISGMIIDARGRPLELPVDKQERDKKLIEWYLAMEAYPAEIFNHLM